MPPEAMIRRFSLVGAWRLHRLALLAGMCVAGVCGLWAESAVQAQDNLTAQPHTVEARALEDRLRARLASGVLRWGGDAEGGAPFQLRDPHDPRRVIGFEVEVADALAEVLGQRLGIELRAEFVQYEWVYLVPGLTKGDFDIILSGLEITPENRAQVRFTRPYYHYAQQLVVRRDEREIASLADCRGRIVGTLNGSAAEQLLQIAGVAELVTYDGQVEPYLELEFGRLDAVLLDGPIVAYYAEPNKNLKLVGSPLGRGAYGLGLRTDDALLAEALDEALGQLMASGRLRDIYRKWHLWNDDQAQLAQGPERLAQLQGLGFAEDGSLLPDDELPPVEMVDRAFLARSATLWTFDRYAPLLLRAAGVTVVLTVVSMAVAMLLGLLVVMARLYGSAPLRWAALGYIEFFRGIPLLFLLFVLYYALPQVGIEMSAWLTAILGFGLNYAAYEAEIYRSAIEAVPRGQWEAGRALGMSDRVIFWRIILPQSLRTALGPITNDFVAMFKDTSLVSVITVHELTKEYQILARSSAKFIELGLLTAALYLAMSVPLGYLSRRLEARTAR